MQNVFIIIISMVIRTEKIDSFLIVNERDKRKRIIKTVFLNYVPVVRFCIDETNERKLAAIDLVERRLCNQTTAGEICNFHRNTVSKLLHTKQLLGIEAVLKDERGLKRPLKYVEKVCSHIKELLKKHPDWTDQAIADQSSKELNTEISRSAVARIRTGGQDATINRKLPGKKELIDMAKVAESIDLERLDARQLELNFDQDPELKQKSEEFSQQPAPKVQRQTELALFRRLQKGERCNFAGGLMHHLFLHDVGFAELLKPLPFIPGATYQDAEILATLFHSVNQGISSIEALKLVNASEFGLLLGCSRSPDKETIRGRLTEIAENYISSDLIDSFAKRLLEQDRIDREVFFIDGHFLPYYGLYTIAKGYYTVRRLAMNGNELYAVTDIAGKPLFFITESNEIDFRPIISRCADKLIDFGITRPLLVFDRGGYGIDFFKELSKNVDFITWAKYVGEKSLARISDDSFNIGLVFEDHKYLVAEELRTVTESVQTAKKEGRQQPTSLKLRLVVLKNVEDGKRIGIYTNNTSKPAYDIGYYMLQRWGDSENFLKEMMARFNLNYHPGYDIAELEKQPLVENPDIPLIKKAIGIINKEIKELEKEILVSEAKYIKRADKRLKTKISKLETELQEKNNDIVQFEQKLASLPDKVSIIDILDGKPMSRCDLEKKKLYDLMQFMAFHSRESLVEVFRNCYDDHRDIKQVLDMITTRPGYVKLIGHTLVVILDWIENKKHRQATERFCHLLNQKGIKLVGRLNVKLFFHLSRIPHHSSKLAPAGVHILS